MERSHAIIFEMVGWQINVAEFGSFAKFVRLNCEILKKEQNLHFSQIYTS